jgi:hypothetical protein
MQINECLTIHERPLDQAAAWVQVFGEKGPAQEIEEISILTLSYALKLRYSSISTNAAKN